MHAVMNKHQGSGIEGKHIRECWNCGRKHEYHKKELCPAYEKTCMICHKLNHFAVKCRGGRVRSVKAVDDTEDNTEILDESQLVTLELESGN